MAALHNDRRLLACDPQLNELARVLKNERDKIYAGLAPGVPRTSEDSYVAAEKLCMLDRIDQQFYKLVHAKYPIQFEKGPTGQLRLHE